MIAVDALFLGRAANQEAGVRRRRIADKLGGPRLAHHWSFALPALYLTTDYWLLLWWCRFR
jgi:hypothetical protein